MDREAEGRMRPITTAAHQQGTRTAANHSLTVAAAPRSSAASLPLALPERGKQEPLPIWLAVLIATPCQARSTHGRHDVSWHCVSGRAVYTNFGLDTERIEPLGVTLAVDETLAVSWTPNATAYTFEVYSQTEQCA